MPDTENVAASKPTAQKPKSKKFVTIAIVSAIMLVEGGGLFFVTKMMYKPHGVDAAELTGEQQALRDAEQEVEIHLPELNAFNKREGRLFLYNMQITIRVLCSKAEEITPILKARESTILDRFNTVVRSAETKYLNEPGLDTIRRQFRFELDKILGDDEMVRELLIPKFFQSPADV